jgi:virulence-associated protein VagC
MEATKILQALAHAGVNVTVQGDRLVIRPASKLTDSMRAALHNSKSELLAMLTDAAHVLSTADDPRTGDVGGADQDARTNCTATSLAKFGERRSRLIRWGWTDGEAETMAAKLSARDRSSDLRVNCTECRHYRRGECNNFRRAGLPTPMLGKDLAKLLQHCNGFQTLSSPEPRADP